MRDYLLAYFYERNHSSNLLGILVVERDGNVIILLNLISCVEFPSSP